MQCDKEQYATKQLAIDAIKAIAERSGSSFHAYKCNVCSFYHISTNGKRKFIKRKSRSAVLTNFKVDSKSARLAPPRQRGFQRSTYKLLSKEMVVYLKRLIDGKNNLEIQKLKYNG